MAKKCQMKDLKIALFDFDGVVVDTEPVYDLFWNDASLRYGTGIEHFAQVIKGTTLPAILETYFADRSEEFKQMVVAESMAFERTMPLPPMPGSIAFLRLLKENNVKMGLVTSSDDVKVRRAFQELNLEGLFDTVVTADRITRGKPDPACYLLAAKDLNVLPAQCLVFEDSFAGIQAGTDAGMRVIALSTTNPVEQLLTKAYEVIPGFEGLTFNDYLVWSCN